MTDSFKEDPARLKTAESVSAEIRTLWKSDAEKIVGLIDQGSEFVAVAAPSGSGKSFNLIPNLIEVGQTRHHPVYFDCQMLPGRTVKTVIPAFERKFQDVRTKDGLAILDEPILDIETIQRSLDLFRQRGIGE